MRKNLTEIVFILDRSGSMSGLEADTIGVIIPEDFEPPVRILRATIPGIRSQSKFRILLSVDYLPRHYL